MTEKKSLIFLEIDGKNTEVEFIRRKIKNFSIKISQNGDVSIAGPIRSTENQAKSILEDKMNWIKKKKSQFNDRESQPKHNFEEGEIFLYRGKEYTLKIEGQQSEKFFLKISLENPEHELVIFNGHAIQEASWSHDFVRKKLIEWYRKEARDIFIKRAEDISWKMGCSYAFLKEKEQKSRWGSCTAKNGIYINWRLIMTEDEILDSVIIHEMAHTFERNHSVKFWDIVKKYDPDYKEHKRWLRLNSNKLFWD